MKQKLKSFCRHFAFLKPLKKPANILLNFIYLIVGTSFPVYCATVYEGAKYANSTGMSQVQAAHAANMIAFAYQVAALFTVLFAYLLTKRLFRVFKAEP